MFVWNNVAGRANQPTRRYPRFSLRFPVQLKFGTEPSAHEIAATTRNVSAGGVLLETEQSIPERCPVRFIMTMEGGSLSRPIRLDGEGVVVRVESQSHGKRFNIAIQCGKPLSELRQLAG